MKLRHKFAAAVAGLIALTGIGGGALAARDYYNEESVTATVTKTDISVSGNDSQYLIFTDHGVMQNEDSLFKWKWNSSDVYNEIHPGCTYEFNTVGWRNHGLSLYPNILEANHVPTEACPTNTPPTP